jgi:hypothetical protein
MPKPNGARIPAQPIVRSRPRRRTHLFSRLLRIAVGVLLLGAVYTVVTLPPYLMSPGTSAVDMRVVQWGRDHHVGWLVSWVESGV